MRNLLSTTRQFSYANCPLQSTKCRDNVNIRVLKLHPPPWYLRWLPRVVLRSFTPLRGTLAPICLKDRPQYKALSYTWGSDPASAKILIDGTKLAITPSLEVALLHLRPKAELLAIWIDQICINQKDGDEKANQVEVMDQIYQSAEEALVWLGSRAEGSDGLMDVLIRMGKFAEDFKLLDYYTTKAKFGELKKIVTKDNLDDPATTKYHAFCDAVMPLFTQQFYAALIALYKRPWFQRVWVLQEFALAAKATFICGNRMISAENLMVVMQMNMLTMSIKALRASPHDRHLAGLLERTSELDTMQPFFAARHRRKTRDAGRIPGDGLYGILQRVHVDNFMQASRDCDMVYGLLALANDRENLGMRPVYHETESQADLVYTRTARAIIKSGKVDLLTLAQHIKKDINLPSWVPDWRCEIRRSFAWLPDEEKGVLFSASAGMVLELVDDAEERVLTLMGFRVDELEQVGGPWSGGERDQVSRFPHEAYINYLVQVRQMCQLSKAKGVDIYASEERRDEAEWRIPVGDIEQDESCEALRATQSWKKAYEQCLAELELQMQWKAFVSFGEFKARQVEVDGMGDKANWYRIRMLEMKGKRLFLSRIGYVGMGPTYIRPGDAIVVLIGASLPFIVRPVGEGKFRLLGECYCDGIMDGEIVAMRKKEKITLI